MANEQYIYEYKAIRVCNSTDLMELEKLLNDGYSIEQVCSYSKRCVSDYVLKKLVVANEKEKNEKQQNV